MSESLILPWDTLIQQVEELAGPLVAEVLRLHGDRHVVEQAIRQLRERAGAVQQVHVIRLSRHSSGAFRQAAFTDLAQANAWAEHHREYGCMVAISTLEIDREVNRDAG